MQAVLASASDSFPNVTKVICHSKWPVFVLLPALFFCTDRLIGQEQICFFFLAIFIIPLPPSITDVLDVFVTASKMLALAGEEAR